MKCIYCLIEIGAGVGDSNYHTNCRKAFHEGLQLSQEKYSEMETTIERLENYIERLTRENRDYKENHKRIYELYHQDSHNTIGLRAK